MMLGLLGLLPWTGLRGQTILSGTYTGATLTGDVVVNPSTSVFFTGGTTLSSGIATLGNSGGIYWRQVGTVNDVDFIMGSGSYLYVDLVGNALTLDSMTTVSGNARAYSDGSAGTAITNLGSISNTTGTGQLYARTFTNEGSITATAGTLHFGLASAGFDTFNTATGVVTADAATISVRGNVANSGLLRAQNGGILDFQGNNTTANLGNVELLSGGSARLSGTLNNTAALLTAPTGGSYQLTGGTIQGGSIAAGALTFTGSGGYLDGSVFLGDLNFANSTQVRFAGGTTFTGLNATFGTSAGIRWEQSGTLSGNTLNFSSSGSFIYLEGSSRSLTLDSATTATGSVNIYADGSAGSVITNQGMITNTGGSTGQLYARTLTNEGTILVTAGTLHFGLATLGYNSFNTATGTITVDGAGSIVMIRGNVANSGLLRAQNGGRLHFQGNTTTANLGNVELLSGAEARLSGTINNTAATLVAPTGGIYQLAGGTIQGGTIGAGALTFTNSGGFVSGSVFLGDLTLPNSTFVRFTGGTSFTGLNATFGNSAGIYWEQSGTLSGNTLNFGTSGSYIYLSGAGRSLTLDNTTTSTGAVNLYVDGTAGSVITHQGTINHTTGTGSLYARTFTNEGTITAIAGTLHVGVASTDYDTFNTETGTITADGSGTNVYIRGNAANSGLLRAQNNGQFIFQGINTTANLGDIELLTGGRALFNGTLNNVDTTLTAPLSGIYELYAGTITGGTIAPGALGFTSSGGYLDGVLFTGDLTLPTSAYVRFTGGSTFSGVNATFGTSSGIFWQQAGALVDNTLTFGTGGYIYVTGAGASLTLDADTVGTGTLSIYTDGTAGVSITNQGTLNHTTGTGEFYGRTATNEGIITATAGTLYFGNSSATYESFNTETGIITADGSGTNLYLRGNVANSGLIRAQNSGQLIFQGSNTTANLGDIELLTGGRALFNGTLNNVDTTLTAPLSGKYELYGGTITGGIIAPGALGFTSSGGFLNGALFTGDLTLPASAFVRFTGGSTFSGINATFGSSSGIYWQQAGTLVDNVLTFGANSYMYVTGAGASLTLDADTVGTGSVNIYTDGTTGNAITNQGTLNHTAGTGNFYGLSATNEGVINATAGAFYFGHPSASYNSFNTATGAITADGSGTTVYLRGNMANSGLIRAQNSAQLIFSGNNTTANLGDIELLTGGRALLNGTLNNSSATLTSPLSGIYELYGGTISGGTIAAGALGFTSSGGYLDGTVFTGDLNFPNSTYARFINGATFTGQNVTFGSSSGIYWQQAGALVDNTLTFSNGAYIYVTGANNTLALDSGTTATGTVNLYTDSNAGTAITNAGIINHTTNTGQIYGRTVTNSGSINVTGGNMYLGTSTSGYTFTNDASGTITLGSGILFLSGPVTNNGTISIFGGTFYVSNFLINGAGGVIEGSATINGNMTLAAGTLSPGASIGTLTFSTGGLTVTGASVLEIEVDGAFSDRIVFQNSTAAVDIGSGLLELSVSLLSAPIPGATYVIMSKPALGSTFTGTFADLPISGSILEATYLGTPYEFTLDYLDTAIHLHAVPEPGTYALMATGLTLLVLWHRRRRA